MAKKVDTAKAKMIRLELPRDEAKLLLSLLRRSKEADAHLGSIGDADHETREALMEYIELHVQEP